MKYTVRNLKQQRVREYTVEFTERELANINLTQNDILYIQKTTEKNTVSGKMLAVLFLVEKVEEAERQKSGKATKDLANAISAAMPSKLPTQDEIDKLAEMLAKEKVETNMVNEDTFNPTSHYNEIIHGDCVEYLKQFPDKSIDLIVTDPPYGVAYESNRRKRLKEHDGVMARQIQGDEDISLMETVLPHFYRILRDDCACYMFLSRKMFKEVWDLVFGMTLSSDAVWKLKQAGISDETIKTVSRTINKGGTKFSLGNILIWDKQNCTAGDLKNWGDQYEVCFYLRKGKHVLDGSRPRNLLSIPRVPSSKMVHPTEKPVELLRSLIEPSTPMGTLVLDPFAGSGSTLEAARLARREYLGFEIDDEHYQKIKARLSQGTLFGGWSG